jgi:hypothetical protein
MTRYYRKIIRIEATDSPNVQLALAQQARGMKPTGQQILEGVVSWQEYQKRLALWDEVLQCIGLRAQFYRGSQNLLYPPLWLNRAEDVARRLDERVEGIEGLPKLVRRAKAIGCDPGEGGAETSWTIVDDLGIMEQMNEKTPDTSVTPNITIALIKQYNVQHEQVLFDRGGGGKQHVDTLRERGYKVRSVGFGESVTMDIRRGMHTVAARRENIEERYAYFNRRAEMYGELRLLLDPNGGGIYPVGTDERAVGGPNGFAISNKLSELRRQLAPIPLKYDTEGRLKLPPKNRRGENSAEKSLSEILGCSPDRSDSLVLAVHALLHPVVRIKVGVGRR